MVLRVCVTHYLTQRQMCIPPLWPFTILFVFLWAWKRIIDDKTGSWSWKKKNAFFCSVTGFTSTFSLPRLETAITCPGYYISKLAERWAAVKGKDIKARGKKKEINKVRTRSDSMKWKAGKVGRQMQKTHRLFIQSQNNVHTNGAAEKRRIRWIWIDGKGDIAEEQRKGTWAVSWAQWVTVCSASQKTSLVQTFECSWSIGSSAFSTALMMCNTHLQHCTGSGTMTLFTQYNCGIMHLCKLNGWLSSYQGFFVRLHKNICGGESLCATFKSCKRAVLSSFGLLSHQCQMRQDEAKKKTKNYYRKHTEHRLYHRQMTRIKLVSL